MKYPLSCYECVKTGTFIFDAPLDPPKWVTPPSKVLPYSLGTCPPKTPQASLKPCHSFIEKKIDFLKTPDFGQNTQTVLEKPIKYDKKTFDLAPMTLIFKLDLDIVKMPLYTENEVPSSSSSKVIARTDRQTDRHTDRSESNYYPSAHADGRNC